MLTIEEIKKNGWLIFEAIVGSKAYGLNTEKSDTDIRGVFVLPEGMFYSIDYIPQVSNETNDIVYFELKRFVELLSKNNPNILELLNVPEHCLLHRNVLMDLIKPEMFLSKLCEQTFASYAYTQIRKAFGLEKKIINPIEKERKSVLDFCYIYDGREAIEAGKFFKENNYLPQKAGLAAVHHLRDCYNIYYSEQNVYSGIVKKEEANDVCLSSIPKGERPIGLLFFNKDAYSAYCKKYREYWDWVDKRNVERYNTTIEHGKNYDSKNMMHVFRLLLMAKEIALEGKVNVWRKDREFLLGIKQGNYEYDELVAKAEILKGELSSLYGRSALQLSPDLNSINNLLIEMRRRYYRSKNDDQRTEH
ncbi:MAG: nucleotidyltransferase domain-containing protein [Chitinophagaceae bacterium]|nr:nucleotidyltransferase domain-containing protein [Chitinophagaceae bacterium]